MKLENGELISEIWPDGHPANYGNSMAESSRYVHLCIWLYTEASRPPYKANLPIELLVFRTSETYIQSASPNCPKDWLVSSDQCIVWHLIMRSKEMEDRIKSAGWRTPDGNLVSPMFYAVLTRNKFLLNLFVGLQALIFKFPWRWNDGYKRIEHSSESSADYLNWLHCALYCSKWIRRLVNIKTMEEKIENYYKPEPNSDWLVNLYKELINNQY